MNSLSTALRCFTHPLTIVSVGVLLLNDHVLKVLVPSWLTGKLSDFAGLFFFPFLLAALLAFVWRDRLTTRQTGLLAFGITAVWFGLMKTTTWGNGYTEQFAALVLQTRTQIVQDPTDVLAMGALFPAWLLWDRTRTTKPPRWAWAVLLVAAFAAMATSPVPPPPSVQHVAIRDNTLVATGDTIPQGISEDGGVTWLISKERLPADQPLVTTSQVCEPQVVDVCYRLEAGQPRHGIEESADGGKTWTRVWQFPPERYAIMQRIANGGCVFGCINAFLPGPYDLALTTPVGNNGKHTLVASMGTEGVLVRTPEGAWNQYAVGRAQPTPTAIRDLDGLYVVGSEMEIGIYAALLVMVLLAGIGWCTLGGTAVLADLRPLRASLALIIGGAIVLLLLDVGLALSFAWYAFVLVLGWLLVALIASVYWVEKRIPPTGAAKWIIVVAVLCAGLFGAGSWLPMLAWAFGYIPTYEVAAILSVVMALALLGVGIFIMRRASQPGTRPADATARTAQPLE